MSAKNDRFTKHTHGKEFRATEGDLNAISAWWNNAVREVLTKTQPKNLTFSDRNENDSFERSIFDDCDYDKVGD